LTLCGLTRFFVIGFCVICMQVVENLGDYLKEQGI
jgi:hypothetical protein